MRTAGMAVALMPASRDAVRCAGALELIEVPNLVPHSCWLAGTQCSCQPAFGIAAHSLDDSVTCRPQAEAASKVAVSCLSSALPRETGAATMLTPVGFWIAFDRLR